MKQHNEDHKGMNPEFVQEDPWEKLSESERKKAERHLFILYAVMIAFAILPFVLFYFFFRRP